MFREVVFFESLFKSNLWIWALGWLFHVGLALVLLRHLRYFTEPVNFIIAFIQPPIKGDASAKQLSPEERRKLREAAMKDNIFSRT